MNESEKGLFITVEGGEGAGKTTLLEFLYTYLSHYTKREVLKTRAPGATALGKKIRDLLLTPGEVYSAKAELLLFLADRAEHADTLIRPALARKAVILCDRFNDSTIAYQAGGRGGDREWIKSLCQFATSHLEPDITFYLDIDPVKAFSRLKNRTNFDRIEQEDLSFHSNVRKTYLELAQGSKERIAILPAEEHPSSIFSKALQLLSSFLPQEFALKEIEQQEWVEDYCQKHRFS